MKHMGFSLFAMLCIGAVSHAAADIQVCEGSSSLENIKDLSFSASNSCEGGGEFGVPFLGEKSVALFYFGSQF